MHSPQPKSVLGIDIGLKRIGLAGCDSLGITITRLPAIHRSNFDCELAMMRKYCTERSVEGLVIGMPLDEKGLPTKQSNHCIKYANKLASCLNLPLAMVNEHSSTWLAKETYNLHKDRSGELDSAAASVLLEQWLSEGPELKPVEMLSNT